MNTRAVKADRQIGFPAPRVTVVVPVYNGEAYLAEALDGALAQSFRSFEIVVVNDGSTDSSGEIANAYAGRHPELVRVIDQTNAGLPAARNRALEAGRGSHFALLDADDVWYADHLQRAMDAFDVDPELALVHANICRIDSHGAALSVPFRLWRKQTDPYLALALRREHVSCPTAVFSRQCIDTLGGFDLGFTGLGCEDRDLWLRIAAQFRIHYIDAITAKYRIHAGSMSTSRERMGAARERLLGKLVMSPRGEGLQTHIRAMILSDLGLEFGLEGRRLKAIDAQLRALWMRPQTLLIWRRLLRQGWQSVLPARAPLSAGAGR